MLKSLQSLIRAVLAINVPCVTSPRRYNYSEGSGDRLELYIYKNDCKKVSFPLVYSDIRYKSGIRVCANILPSYSEPVDSLSNPSIAFTSS
jgi:hypothetical protein